MKKFIVISLFMLICISSLFAQDVLVQHWAGDAGYTFVSFVGPDLNPAIDGWTLELYVSVDGVIDGLDPVTRLPLGDDLLAVNQENGYFMDVLNGGIMTGAPGQWYGAGILQVSDPVGSPAEPVVNLGDNYYFVLYNDADPVVAATHYCTSELLVAPSSGGPYDLPIEVWYDDAWVPFGGGTPGYGEGTSETGESTDIDVELIDVDNHLPARVIVEINPDVTFDPVTGPLALAVQVDGDYQGPCDPPPFPARVIVSYVTTFTGATDQQIDFVLHYSGLGVDLNEICWCDGTEWICDIPGAVFDNVLETVTFSVTPTVPMDGVFEFVIGTDNPCPVTLSNFATAVFANEFVEISWTTATEQGNVGWNIYRGLSDDAQLASQINVEPIAGAGSTSQPTDYNFMDEYVENNTTYWYWLESINIDGTTEQYGPSTLNVEFEEDPVLPIATELFGNYPNPFNPVTTIKFNVKDGETAKLTIFDIKGRVVENATYGPGEQTHTWEANSSASGVYFYKLQSESITSVKKMMLLK